MCFDARQDTVIADIARRLLGRAHVVFRQPFAQPVVFGVEGCFPRQLFVVREPIDQLDVLIERFRAALQPVERRDDASRQRADRRTPYIRSNAGIRYGFELALVEGCQRIVPALAGEDVGHRRGVTGIERMGGKQGAQNRFRLPIILRFRRLARGLEAQLIGQDWVGGVGGFEQHVDGWPALAVPPQEVHSLTHHARNSPFLRVELRTHALCVCIVAERFIKLRQPDAQPA